MCIGNTTSPAATNTNYIGGWRRQQAMDDPEAILPTIDDQGKPNKETLKASSRKSQSSKTTGGTY